MILLELYIGDQLLDMISTTAAFNSERLADDPVKSRDFGWSVALHEFIPSTMVNRFLQHRIVEVLRQKYGQSYSLLVNTRHDDWKQNQEQLYLISELRLAYNTCWTGFNLAVDIVVYIVTNDVAIALAVGGFIEAIRRLKF